MPPSKNLVLSGLYFRLFFTKIDVTILVSFLWAEVYALSAPSRDGHVFNFTPPLISSIFRSLFLLILIKLD